MLEFSKTPYSAKQSVEKFDFHALFLEIRSLVLLDPT